MSQQYRDYDDGRSAVSSFYGGRRSQDVFRKAEAQQPPRQRERRDSHSTFFGKHVEDYSADQQDYRSPRSPDYPPTGRGSHSAHGRDEEANAGAGGGWDVFADFNNAGPRYSTAFGVKNDGYQPLSRPDTLGSSKPKSSAYTPEVEMVTVPALGPEWKSSELRDMTSRGKRDNAARERKVAFRQWWRDQRGLCGVPWLTRKTVVWGAFGTIVSIGLLLVFLLPRVPKFAFNDDTPLNNVGGTPVFNRSPANFTFQSALDLQVDTSGSFIPVHFNSLKAEIYSADTYKKVAEGELGPWTFKAKQYEVIQLNVTFAYEAANVSDTTWTNFYDACKNKIQFPDGKRPGLNLILILKMKILGLIGTQKDSTTMSTVGCPVELPTNAG
ncbi:hypothetical protein FRC02_000993 [Tulasnella sp. 418]|nr:hypothetical protein FRC02_000993 [Tulasnella sp. 418]